MRDEKENLLKLVQNHKQLFLHLGDTIPLLMKWNVENKCYEDMMGTTSLSLIYEIIEGKAGKEYYITANEEIYE